MSSGERCIMTRKFKGYWIKSPWSHAKEGLNPAPFYRKTFELSGEAKEAKIFLCGLGWHELYVNGVKVDDRVLAPTVTMYNHRASYIEYDVTHLLRPGKNAVAVILGCGWFDCDTKCIWSFQSAPWRDYIKFVCDVVVDGVVVAKSDESWKRREGPIRYNMLREGEYYDARMEIEGFASPDFDDSAWECAVQTPPPGGLLEREETYPCRVIREYDAVAVREVGEDRFVYDFGTNFTGWCEIELCGGMAGDEVTLEYSELIDDKGDIDTGNISIYVYSGAFQTDKYILKGADCERWHPRFTYHGFRYVRVTIKRCMGSKVKVKSIKGQFIATAFAKAGELSSSHETLNRLYELSEQSYLSNFTGIPTDCPHREKNGWTGDANFVCEFGLWAYDAKEAYRHFAKMMCDAQHPSGQFPGYVPTPGSGYNYYNGPAWDSCLFEIVWNIYLFYGDAEPAREFYGNMLRYIDYCEGMSEDNLVRFGLGEWCVVDPENAPPTEVTSTGYYYQDCRRLAAFAALFGKDEDAARLNTLADKIRESFNRKYYNGNGTYSNGSMTALGTALYFDLALQDKELTAERLVALVREREHRVYFGVLGSKFVPRVLADYGYIDDAFELITQRKYPGWGNWIEQGATTFWESWDGKSSQNHVFFADIAAWMYQYLGGVTPSFAKPGFKDVEIKPHFPKKLDSFKMRHSSPYGDICVEWKRVANEVVVTHLHSRGEQRGCSSGSEA